MSLTPKQEAAAQAFIECGDKSEAYRRAYDTKAMKPATINRAAFELFENPKIAARVAELQQFHRKRHAVTVDSITRELEEARTIAIADQQASAAVAASLGKAKLHGLMVEKQEHTGKNGGPIETKSTVTLTPDEAYRKLLNG